MAAIRELGGERVLCLGADGPLVDSERRALDIIGDAMGEGASAVAVPVGRLGDDFFALRTGIAGAITQKFVTYRLKLVVVGDITDHVACSDALRDWVRESNRRNDLWFVASLDDLAARLHDRPVQS